MPLLRPLRETTRAGGAQSGDRVENGEVRSVDEQVRGQLEERMHAFDRAVEQRDVSAAAAVLDDDYALVLAHPEPAVVPRERWLEVLPEYVVHEYVVRERTLDIDGDCACVLQRVDMRATVLGQDRSGPFVLTDVWRRRASEWYVWRRHSTPLQAGTMPGA